MEENKSPWSKGDGYEAQVSQQEKIDVQINSELRRLETKMRDPAEPEATFAAFSFLSGLREGKGKINEVAALQDGELAPARYVEKGLFSRAMLGDKTPAQVRAIAQEFMDRYPDHLVVTFEQDSSTFEYFATWRL